MSNATQHVIKHPDGGWSVKKGGSDRATKIFQTQKEAIAWGVAVSKNQGAELFIHREDGLIREKSSYGRDPHPSQG